jgi:glycine/D-amino acid oxidase-like deaminating enzyme
MTTNILIVGAGMLGSSIAWRLAEGGAQVTVVDAGAAQEQASEGSLCWLNVASCADAAYAEFRIRSLRMWHQIASRHPGCPVSFQGSVVWTADPGTVDRQIELMERLDWPARRLGAPEIEALFPGGKALPSSALFAPDEGAAHPETIVGWVRAMAEAQGARFIAGTVAALSVRAGCVTGAALACGTELAADAVVVAAGRATTALLDGVGIPLLQRPGAGLTGWSAPCAPAVPHAISSDRLDFWQDAAGRVLFTSPSAKTPENASGMDLDDMIGALASLVPQLAGIPVQASFARSRPLPLDGFPALGHGGRDGLFVACTHSGMTLAPVIAECLAAEILRGATDATPARYRSRRFLPNAAPVA